MTLTPGFVLFLILLQAIIPAQCLSETYMSPSPVKANHNEAEGFTLSKNSPGQSQRHSRTKKKKSKKKKLVKKRKSAKRPESDLTDHWNSALVIRGGLISTPFPSLGLGVNSRPSPLWGLNLSWENGSIEPDSDIFISPDADSDWTVSSLTISATRLALTGRWFILPESWIGAGYYQKNILVTIGFIYDGSANGNFNVTGSLLSRGLVLHWGSQWVISEKILIEVIWIGLDWPFWSEIFFEGQNDTLSVGLNDEFLARQGQTKSLIHGIKNYPLPSIIVFQIGFIF